MSGVHMRDRLMLSGSGRKRKRRREVEIEHGGWGRRPRQRRGQRSAESAGPCPHEAPRRADNDSGAALPLLRDPPVATSLTSAQEFGSTSPRGAARTQLPQRVSVA